MRSRGLLVWLVAGMLLLGSSPALAQEDPESDAGSGSSGEPGSVEPMPATRSFVYFGEVEITSGGSTYDAAPAGARSELVATLYNGGEDPVSDVKVKLSDAPSFIRVVDGNASVGTIGGGKSAKATFVVDVDESGCEDFVGILATIDSSLGTDEMKFGFGVLCPGPRLYQEGQRYVGGDGDQVPEPGERLEVFVTLRNHGRDAATDVRGALKLTENEHVTLITKNATWPDIAPGKAAESTTAFVIEIAKDAPQQEGCDWHGGPVVIDGHEPVSSEERVVESEGTVVGGTEEVPPMESGDADKRELVLEEPAPEPAEAPEMGVAFDGTLTVTASGQSFETGLGNVMFCAMAEGRPMGPTDRGAIDDVADGDEKALAGRAVGATDSSSGARGTGLALAGLLLAAAVSFFVRYRFSHTQ